MDIALAAELLETCVFQPDQCAVLFDQVADALGLRFFHLTNLAGKLPEYVTGYRILPALEEYQATSLFEHDTWTQAAMRRPPPPGELLFDTGVIDDEARRGSYYYQDYCRRHDVAFHGGWATDTGAGPITFAIFRSASQGDFTAENRQALALLAPTANRAARLMVETRRSRSVGLAQGFEAAGKPSLLVDQSGRVSLVTPAAEALFDREFGVRGDMLCAADPESNRRLSLIAAVARGGWSDSLLPNVVVRRRSGLPIVLSLSPVRGSGLDALPGARLVISCVDLAQPNRIDAALLQSLFGMTPTEAAICSELAKGLSIDEIAQARGMKSSSVRQLVKSILVKSDTHRQAALVALLSRLAD